jgi:hypothetical protein
MYLKQPNKIRFSLQVHKVLWPSDEDGSKERTATGKDDNQSINLTQ